MTTTRDYNSPARDRAKAETRMGILQGVIDVVLQDGVHAFTVQNVAKKAGVSHRTVYRHFPTREALLDGLAEHLDGFTRLAGVPSNPDSVGAIADAVGPSFEQFGKIADGMQAYVITSIALQLQTTGRRVRSALFAQALRKAFPHLDACEIRKAAALIRSIASSRSWFLLTAEEGLDHAEAGEAASWAIRALLDDLRRRDLATRDPEQRS